MKVDKKVLSKCGKEKCEKLDKNSEKSIFSQGINNTWRVATETFFPVPVTVTRFLSLVVNTSFAAWPRMRAFYL